MARALEHISNTHTPQGGLKHSGPMERADEEHREGQVSKQRCDG